MTLKTNISNLYLNVSNMQISNYVNKNVIYFFDKIIITVLFLFSYFYNDNISYIFHLVGAFIIFVLTTTTGLDSNISALLFSIIFGLVNIFEYEEKELFYKVVLSIVVVIYLTQIYINPPVNIIMSLAVGGTFAVFYIYILLRFGFKSKKDNKEKEEKKKRV